MMTMQRWWYCKWKSWNKTQLSDESYILIFLRSNSCTYCQRINNDTC